MKTLILLFCVALVNEPLSSQNDEVKDPAAGIADVTVMDSTENYFWMGTKNGVFRVNRKSNRKKYYSLCCTGQSVNRVTDLHCMEDGCVWIATNNGLIKYDNYTFIAYTTENSNLPENFITGIMFKNNSDLVISTAHYGFKIMHRNNFRNPENEPVKTQSKPVQTALK